MLSNSHQRVFRYVFRLFHPVCCSVSLWGGNTPAVGGVPALLNSCICNIVPLKCAPWSAFSLLSLSVWESESVSQQSGKSSNVLRVFFCLETLWIYHHDWASYRENSLNKLACPLLLSDRVMSAAMTSLSGIWDGYFFNVHFPEILCIYCFLRWMNLTLYRKGYLFLSHDVRGCNVGVTIRIKPWFLHILERFKLRFIKLVVWSTDVKMFSFIYRHNTIA